MKIVPVIVLTLMLAACQTTKVIPVYYCPAPDPSLMVPGQQLQVIPTPPKAPAATGASRDHIT
jgi:hypothetical protein